MDGQPRVPGVELGHPLDRMTFGSAQERAADLGEFWHWVQGFFHTFPGPYEDVPETYREESAEMLAAN